MKNLLNKLFGQKLRSASAAAKATERGAARKAKKRIAEDKQFAEHRLQRLTEELTEAQDNGQHCYVAYGAYTDAGTGASYEFVTIVHDRAFRTKLEKLGYCIVVDETNPADARIRRERVTVSWGDSNAR